MKIAPNFKRDEHYYYVSKAALACMVIFGRTRTGSAVTVHNSRKNAGPDCHRVKLEVVRTAAECQALRRKYAFKRKKFAQLLAKHVAKSAPKET